MWLDLPLQSFFSFLMSLFMSEGVSVKVVDIFILEPVVFLGNGHKIADKKIDDLSLEEAFG